MNPVSAFSIRSPKGSAFSIASKEVKILEKKITRIFSVAEKDKLLADFAESKEALIAKKLELDSLRIAFEEAPLQKNFDAVRMCGDQYKELEKISYQVFCIAFDAGCYPELYDPTENPDFIGPDATQMATTSSKKELRMDELD